MKYFLSIIAGVFILASSFWFFQKDNCFSAFFNQENQSDSISLIAVEEEVKGVESQKKKSIMIYGSVVLICIISTKFILFPYDLLPLGIGMTALLLLWKKYS